MMYAVRRTSYMQDARCIVRDTINQSHGFRQISVTRRFVSLMCKLRKFNHVPGIASHSYYIHLHTHKCFRRNTMTSMRWFRIVTDIFVYINRFFASNSSFWSIEIAHQHIHSIMHIHDDMYTIQSISIKLILSTIDLGWIIHDQCCF